LLRATAPLGAAFLLGVAAAYAVMRLRRLCRRKRGLSLADGEAKMRLLAAGGGGNGCGGCAMGGGARHASQPGWAFQYSGHGQHDPLDDVARGTGPSRSSSAASLRLDQLHRSNQDLHAAFRLIEHRMASMEASFVSGGGGGGRAVSMSNMAGVLAGEREGEREGSPHVDDAGRPQARSMGDLHPGGSPGPQARLAASGNSLYTILAAEGEESDSASASTSAQPSAPVSGAASEVTLSTLPQRSWWGRPAGPAGSPPLV